MKPGSLYSILLAFPPALCHMQMSWPYPLRSSYNPANSYQDIDYSMTSPLHADGSDYPCKGYQKDGDSTPTATYIAGSTYNMSLAGSATHGGGSCQLSLSYDNGATFRVIKSMIGGCPLTTTYDFTIPSYMPSGSALLAWTWQNLQGNREFYMNCASVKILPGVSRRRSQTAYTSVDSLPYVWRANLEGINNCSTAEGVNPVYPDPGPEVQYGDGMSSSDPASAGNCMSPEPYGPAYRAARADNLTASTSFFPQASPSTLTATTSTSRASITPVQLSATTSLSPTSYAIVTPSSVTSSSHVTQSTTTITVAECPGTVTITITPTVYTASAPSAACTGSSASCPCSSGYQCQLIGTCEWECLAASTMATSTSAPPQQITITPTLSYTAPSSTNTYAITSTVSPTPVSTSPPSSDSASTQPPYAGSDVEAYLPCVPGTFLCSSATTFYTCDYNDGTVASSSPASWAYDYPRQVADGMQCQPSLSPYDSDTIQYAQQAQTPSGYYRNDQYVRAA